MILHILKSLWGLLGIAIYGCTHVLVAWPTMGFCHLINRLFVKREYQRHRLYFAYFDFWSVTYLWMMRGFFRMKIQFEGLDDIPKNEAVILVSDHLSFFDHLINAELLRRLGTPHALWAMKAQVYNYWGIGGWAEAVGCAALKRGDDREGDLNHLEGMARIAAENNESVLIYPQGRRNLDGDAFAHFAGFERLASTLSLAPIVYVHLDFGPGLYAKTIWQMADFMGRTITVTVTRAERSVHEDLLASFQNHFGIQKKPHQRRSVAK
ncbi:MAG: lysophospholipid acyltransferase family protein [bacterium]|nr:lysophospholipid acyltransferase family protein [bacterium]